MNLQIFDVLVYCLCAFWVVPSQSPKNFQVELTFGRHKQDVVHIRQREEIRTLRILSKYGTLAQ